MITIETSVRILKTSLKICICGPEFVLHPQNEYGLAGKNNLPSSMVYFKQIA